MAERTALLGTGINLLADQHGAETIQMSTHNMGIANPATAAKVRDRVKALTARFPLPY
jgi:hypothetical protein